MTNREILQIGKGLNDLNELKLPLNIKTGYILARNKQMLSSYMDLIQNKQMELYRKYGEKTEDGMIRVDNKDMPQLNEELESLLDVENDVNITKLKIEDFGDVKVPFGVMEDLLRMIEE